MTMAATSGTALVEEMLSLAHGLVRDGWCQGHAAVDAAGRPVEPTSAFACKWSAPGALERVWARHEDRYGDALDAYKRANLALAGAVSGIPQVWNDEEGRTVLEVLDALAEAIRLVMGSPAADPPRDLYPLVA